MSTSERLRFLSPSTADTDWLRGILDFLEGDTVPWLKRFLLTFVTSVNVKKQNKQKNSTDPNNFLISLKWDEWQLNYLELVALVVVVLPQQFFLLEHRVLALPIHPNKGYVSILTLLNYKNHNTRSKPENE